MKFAISIEMAGFHKGKCAENGKYDSTLMVNFAIALFGTLFLLTEQKYTVIRNITKMLLNMN